jgi:hypothetical protein
MTTTRSSFVNRTYSVVVASDEGVFNSILMLLVTGGIYSLIHDMI